MERSPAKSPKRRKSARPAPSPIGMSAPENVLATLAALQAQHELSILKLSEPISSAHTHINTTTPLDAVANADNATARTSDVSTSSLDAPTPASLDADLAHYRELFAKLRFSYVEQVTKEKFIRAIVGDPPLIVTPAENAALERANNEAKAALKARKADVAAAAEAIDARARGLARRHGAVAEGAATLRELPPRVAELEEAVGRLREAEEELKGGGEHKLPLARTLELVAAKEARVAELDRELARLGALLPRRRKEAERLAAELGPLEARRANVGAAAAEAQKRKREAASGDGAGVKDDLEERGRWYRASEAVMRQMLEV